MIRYAQMPQYSCAAAYFAMLSDSSAAGYADTARYRRVCADAHVVRDLNLVVQFDPIFNYRIIQRATVYSGIRAYFHIIADNHAPDLRNLQPALPVQRDAKSICTDYHTGMHDQSVSQHTIVIHHNARIKARVIPYGCPVTNSTAGHDHAMRTYADPCAYHHMRADMRRFGDLRAFSNHGAGVYARQGVWRGVQECRNFSEVDIGIVADDAGKVCCLRICHAHYHCTSACGSQLCAIFTAGQEGKVLGLRTFQRGDLVDPGVSIALHPAAETCSDITQGILFAFHKAVRRDE